MQWFRSGDFWWLHGPLRGQASLQQWFNCVTGSLQINRQKPHLVPSLELPQLPQISLDDSHRAHEPAQAGAVRAEDDGHVAGEVHCADGVRVVVDVGGVQTGFATVSPYPFRLRPDEANAGAAGVEMHFPVGGEKALDIALGEIFRSG